MKNTTLDELDRKMLDIIQADFPMAPRPYLELGRRLGIGELDAYERVRKMRRSGLIRRLGANFQSTRLGFASTLCAAKVPKDRLQAFIEAVNAIPGVTHNYERDHEYNIWFTLICRSREEASAILNDLEAATGIAALNLPATRLFKIRVNFEMN